MDVFVPFDPLDPKRRLEPPLSAFEREAFAHAMLEDVLAAIEATDHAPHVLSTAPLDIDASVMVDERPLTRATNSLLRLSADPVAIIMADLPLVTPAAVDRLIGTEGDVVLVPGVGGGTNAAVVRSDDFAFDFHGCSIRDHHEAATAAGCTVATVDSYVLGVDIDEPGDLPEVLLHADGAAATWLADHGFVVVADDEDRVGIERRSED